LFVFTAAPGFSMAALRYREAVEIAAKIGIPVISIDYRRTDHPAPATIDDGVALWREILRTKDPGKIALGRPRLVAT
jgi:acetyl esterase/lipase